MGVLVKYIGLVFIIVGCFCFDGNGQTLTVISLEDSQPLPEVRIDVRSSNQVFSYRTNFNGEWTLAPEFQNKRIDLSVSYLGYATLEIKNITVTKDTTLTLTSSIKDFEEIAVTAQYKAQLTENTVHNIKIIDQQKIEAMAAQNLKDVLMHELNIHLTEDNILGSGLQLQGIGGENVKILIDDIPLTGRQNGNIDLSQIQMDNVERIEIVEGPLSVSYGTDALAGTINIITKKNQTKKVEVISNNYLESSGKINNNLSVGWRLGKHQIRLEGGRHFFDGWDPSHTAFYFKKPVADSSRVQLWKPKTQLFSGVNYRYNRKNTLFNYSGEYYDENIINRGLPRKPYNETAFDDYYQTRRLNQRLNFDYRFKNTYRISILTGYSGYFRQKSTKVRDLTMIKDVLSADPNDHDTSQFHSFMTRGKWIQSSDDKNLNYEVGFDFQYEISKGRRIESQHQEIGDYALYITAEYTPIESLTLRPGLRYGYNTEYKTPFTPSLNIKYSLLHKEKQNLTLRASYARGFRSPSIKELHYTFVDVNHNIVGNQDLKAENSNNYNLSLHQDLKVKSSRLKNKLVLFYNDIQDMITLAQSSATEYSYYNLSRFASTGARLESQINYKNIYAGVGVGYIGRYNAINSDKDFKINNFLLSPEVNFNFQYNWKKPGLQLDLFYKYCGVLPQVVSNELGEFSLATIKDYHLADFRISKQFWKNRLKVSVGVKNLFDVISVEGSEGNAIEAHSSGSGTINVGTGRTYNMGVKLYINSK